MKRRETFNEYFARVAVITGFPVSAEEMRPTVLMLFKEGYSVSAVRALFEKCLDAAACDHPQISAETMICDFCAKYCGPGRTLQ